MANQDRASAIRAELLKRELAKRQSQQAPAKQEGPVDVVDNTNERGFGDSFAADYLKHLGGAASAAGSVLNSAVAEPIAGIAGLSSLTRSWFSGSPDVEKANETINQWRDALTFVSPTQEGEDMLRTVAAPIMKLDETAKDVGAYLGGDNEYAQTAIYTAIMGGIDLLGIKGGRNLRRSAKIEQAKEIADRLGVRPTPNEMPSDVINAARKMSSDVQAANAGQLQQSLLKAKQLQEARLNSIRDSAKARRAFVNVENTAEFAGKFRKSVLEEGFDLDIMPQVQRRLQELESLGQIDGLDTPVKARRIQDWMTIRNRIDRKLESTVGRRRIPDTTDERLVLNRLKNEMDDNLRRQFNEDMISGTPESVSLWRDFTQARDAFNETFNTDKTIIKLIEAEATPEQLKRWLMGANAANASPQMAQVMGRIKEILGPGHPAIEGIRQDFLFDISRPLLQDPPNLQRFVDNVDNVFKKQNSVVKALGLNRTDLMPLRNLASISLKNPPIPAVKLIKDWGQAFSRFTIGHQISKAAMRVSLMTNIWRKLSGAHPSNQKKLLAEFAQAQFGGPVIDKKSIAAGRLIESAFFADFQEIVGKEDENMESEE